MTDGLMSLQEVLQILKLSEQEIQSHIRKGHLNAYRIGGVYLRFNRDQVLSLKQTLEKKQRLSTATAGRARDFWQFNNFYILAAIVLAVVLFFVLR